MRDPKMVGLITVENPMNKDDLGVPLFQYLQGRACTCQIF